MARKLWVVVKREYLERVRSKWFIISTVLGPVFLGALTILPLVLGARTKGSPDVSHIIILDATGTDLGTRVSNALAGGIAAEASQARVEAVAPDTLSRAEDAALHEVMRGAGAPLGYLVLDQSTLAGDSVYYAGRNATTLLDVNRIRDAVRQSVLALRLAREGLQPERIQALTNVTLRMSAERISERGREGSGMASVIFGYVVGFLLYVMLVLYGQQILRGVMEEKTSRVAEVVVSSAPTDVLLAGKVIGVGGASLTQMVVWIGTTLVLFAARGPILAHLGVADVHVPLPPITVGAAALLLLFFVAGFTLYASLFAAMGATVNSDQDAQQAAMPVILMLVASIIFIQPILLNPTSTLAKTMSWIPFTAPILMPIRMSMIQLPWYELAATLLGVVLTCVVGIWAAARIYRVGLLMYGKRPGFAELVRWLRVAR